MNDNETYIDFFNRLISTCNPSKIIAGDYYIDILLKEASSHYKSILYNYKDSRLRIIFNDDMPLLLMGTPIERHSKDKYHIDLIP